MRRVIIIFVSAAALCTSAIAQPSATGICGAIVDRIESIQMDLATTSEDSIADNSAPRATMRAAQDTAAFTEAMLLLRQMELARCPLYPSPIGARRYMLAAGACAVAKLKFKSGDDLHECERSKWKPMGSQ